MQQLLSLFLSFSLLAASVPQAAAQAGKAVSVPAAPLAPTLNLSLPTLDLPGAGLDLEASPELKLDLKLELAVEMTQGLEEASSEDSAAAGGKLERLLTGEKRAKGVPAETAAPALDVPALAASRAPPQAGPPAPRGRSEAVRRLLSRGTPFRFEPSGADPVDARNGGLEGFLFRKREVEAEHGPDALVHQWDAMAAYLRAKLGPGVPAVEAALDARDNAALNAALADHVEGLRAEARALDRRRWAKRANVYEIFPRAYNLEGRRAAAGLPSGAGGTFFADFSAADFAELRRSNPRLDTLWVMGAWTPNATQLLGTKGSPYSVRDHATVDPELGTNDDLKGFVERAHAAGFKVALDFVPNHTAMDAELLEAHPEFYVTYDAPREGTFLKRWADGTARYVQHGGFDNLGTMEYWEDSAQLDYSKPEVRAYMKDLARRLVNDTGADALRVDMAYMLTNATQERYWGKAMPEGEFLDELADAIHGARPEAALIAEALESDRGLRDTDIDVFYNKSDLSADGLKQEGWYDALESRNPRGIRRALAKLAFLHWQAGAAGGLQFIGNHDERSPKKAFGAFWKGALLLSAFLPTAQLHYASNELLADFSDAESQAREGHKALPFSRDVKIDWSANPEARAYHEKIFAAAAEFYARHDPAGVTFEPVSSGFDPWVGYVLRAKNESLFVAANPTGWELPLEARVDGRVVRMTLDAGEGGVRLLKRRAGLLARLWDRMRRDGPLAKIAEPRPKEETALWLPAEAKTRAAKKILMIAPEAVPFKKVGGLADVVTALSIELAQKGNEVRLILPLYDEMELPEGAVKLPGAFSVEMGERGRQAFDVHRVVYKGVEVYFVDHMGHLGVADPYERAGQLTYSTGVDPAKAGKDDISIETEGLERFVFFSRAALATARTLGFRPDVVHAHDWPAALVPSLIKHEPGLFFDDAATVLTLHNMAWQGWLPEGLMDELDLAALKDSLALREGWSMLKGGIADADVVNTVSRRYAEEILDPEKGMGMEGPLRERHAQGDLVGMVNGLDYEQWSPDYGVDEADAARAQNRAALRALWEMKDGPGKAIFGMTSRLDYQKGLDIVAKVAPEMIKLGAQLVMTGVGNKDLSELYAKLAAEHPDDTYVPLSFSEADERRIHASADFHLLPSRFEPCGQAQTKAMRYGCVPVVSETGGLSDTVADVWTRGALGTGLFLRHVSPLGLYEAVERAMILFHLQEAMRQASRRGMQTDFSWDASAEAYLDAYERAMAKLSSE